jgi:hypothetical protein
MLGTWAVFPVGVNKLLAVIIDFDPLPLCRNFNVSLSKEREVLQRKTAK